MTDEARIQQILEEVLDSQRTPEEVCGGDPELLGEIRQRWERIQCVGNQIDALFPSVGPTRREDGAVFHAKIEPPKIDGYEVEGILGRGGMGVVFKARHLKLKRLVALKMLLAGAYAGPEELARFRREAEAVAALRHPHIVQIYDVGELSSGPYFTMELVEGGSLAQILKGQAQPTRQAAELVAALACAVQFAHQSGFIHRDLKPGNILLTADGVPKITDFGLARPIDASPEFTRTGARMGTPSYMAPEQALGKTSAIGPAVDIYALGAVLYELLTGRPPFEGESATDTERKVIANEPIPPSRLNAKVSRDLETICLKCLQKDPTRRYASAQDLGDDLHRFLDGKLVVARPVGMVESAMKWGRRRPAFAGLGIVLFVLLAISIGFGIWLQQTESSRQTEKTRREERARLALETAIDNAYAAAQQDRWMDSNHFLEDATSRLTEANSDDLGRRVDQAKQDVQFVSQLAGIRRTLPLFKPIETFFTPMPLQEWWADEYAKIFAEAGFDIDGDAEAVAARIRSARLSEQIIAAVDQWALAAFLLDRAPLQNQLLRIGRLADPDLTWRDRLRDPGLWRDEIALRRLAKDSLIVTKPPFAHQLCIAGVLLRNQGAQEAEIDLLHHAVLKRPADYVLHWDLAHALSRSKRYREATSHLRVAIALRPANSWIENQLGFTLCLAGGADELEEGIEHLRQAVVLDPKNTLVRYNLALGLEGAGRPKEARAECSSAIKDNPTDPWAYHALGKLHMGERRWGDALPMLQKAIEYRPGDKGAHFNRGLCFNELGRREEALAEFRKIISLQESNIGAHEEAGQTLLGLRRHEEARIAFLRVLRAFDEAKDRTDMDLDDSSHTRARLGLVEALLGLGRFTEAKIAADRALELPGLHEKQQKAVERHEEIARRLAPFEGRLASILAGKEMPSEFATQRVLAEWLYKHKRATIAAARVYEDLYTKQPKWADKLDAQSRLQAGIAAALVGYGEDPAGLSEGEKAAWRKKALVWLQAERPRHGEGSDPMDAIRAALSWQENEDLAVLRTDAALARLPEVERAAWANLWAEVNALAATDPLPMLENGRSHIDGKQWAKAAAVYAKLFKDAPTLSGEVWFEYAAVQLLAGDRDGYRDSCKYMLKNTGKGKMRSYHVARACTLAPDSSVDATAPGRVSAEELARYQTQFWSLTEQGALHVRKKQSKQAVPLLTRSIKLEPKPGAAVVNWLWLSLAHHDLGDKNEALRWLKKSAGWLDQLGTEMPARAEGLGLHRHNWLEAHVLRREAEMLFLPSPSK